MTSLVQPIGQGVIECLKSYKKKLVSSVLQNKKLDLLDALKIVNIYKGSSGPGGSSLEWKPQFKICEGMEKTFHNIESAHCAQDEM